MKEILKKTLGAGFRASSHREDYVRIAKRYHVRARRVYRLAHGKKASSAKEEWLLDELVNMKIMYRK